MVTQMHRSTATTCRQRRGVAASIGFVVAGATQSFWAHKSLVADLTNPVWTWQVAPKTAAAEAGNTSNNGNIVIANDGTATDGPGRQKVFVLPENLKTDEHRHIFIDGISKSDRLEISSDMLDEDSYWFVDITSNRIGFNELEQAMARRTAALGPNRNQTIIYADWSDGGCGEDQLASLFSLASLHFGRGNVRYVTRQHVDSRHIRNITYDDEFRNLGVKWDWNEAATEFGLGGRIKVARYSVRSDLVESISNISGVHNMDETAASPSLIPLLPRPKDAVSFWYPGRAEDPFSGVISELRASVSKLVLQLGSKEVGGLNVTAGVAGEMAGAGRNQVSDAYVHDLLEHKIVVVAQRDEWEGHYRLMEALCSGALVMTDPMHPLPYLLEDGVNVVVYSSLRELKEKILFYVRHEKERLEIAVRGHTVAMNHHRSWHVMERIVLGNWTTEHF